jgi:hypothetical protein
LRSSCCFPGTVKTLSIPPPDPGQPWNCLHILTTSGYVRFTCVCPGSWSFSHNYIYSVYNCEFSTYLCVVHMLNFLNLGSSTVQIYDLTRWDSDKFKSKYLWMISTICVLTFKMSFILSDVTAFSLSVGENFTLFFLLVGLKH